MKRLYDLLSALAARVKACVKSVNGVKPDASGNVQIEVGSGGTDFSEDEIVQAMLEANALPAILDDSGAIMTDDSGNILLV